LKRVRRTAVVAAPGQEGRQGPDFKLSMAVGGACRRRRQRRGLDPSKSGSETHQWGEVRGGPGRLCGALLTMWRDGGKVKE
jgi:hypothetical protein